MSDCETVLEPLQYMREVNNLDVLKGIVNRLPFHMKTKWTEQASKLLRSNTQVTFSPLAAFVRERAELASNEWGENLRSGGFSVKTDDRAIRGNKQTPKPRALFATEVGSTQDSADCHSTVMVKDQSYKTKCTFCSGKHFIVDCANFKTKPVEDRCTFVKENRLCFNCLIPYHSARKCRQDGKCDKCDYKHHSLCHRESFQPAQRDDEGQGKASVNAVIEGSDSEASVNTAQSAKPRVCLPIIPVRVTVGSKSLMTHALLDTGSTTTLCKESLIQKLGVTGTDITYHLTTVKGKCEETHGVEVDLQVGAINGGETLRLRDVWSTPDLPISLRNRPTQQTVRQWSHLSDIQIPDIPASEVTLLIGIDNAHVFKSLEERRGKPVEPFAVKTPLGWMLYGLPSAVEAQHSLPRHGSARAR